MHDHLSSLNSINEVYQSVKDLTTSRNTVKSARTIFFNLMKDQLKPLPKFTDAFNSLEDETPCSEDIYFAIFDALNKERKIAEAVKASSIKIGTQLGIYFNGEYGELEILNEIETYGGEEYYHRHSFVLTNRHILDVRHLVDRFMHNEIKRRHDA